MDEDLTQTNSSAENKLEQIKDKKGNGTAIICVINCAEKLQKMKNQISQFPGSFRLLN